ncbi:hypothetical protein [Pontibacter liquoris]|uniref:hypothetical protein n=1 Tax=Pontibacter liquoris TaxID=2905677 RepID=UPI001FA6D6DB|nr:hypothetical protein [Pontibacter liquoris]
MAQHIFILLLFLAALVYMGRLVYRSFSLKGNCVSGCSGCATIDFNKIQKDLEKKAQLR